MPRSTHPLTDPLEVLLRAQGRSLHPIPLVSTALDVEIDGGLALVETRRLFRNVEAVGIEATLTFPVPVGAVLFFLQARIGERILTARAKAREEARETYEAAIDAGRTAVLHEELLRGCHMLSVAHIPPGAEVEVTTLWTATLSCIGDRGLLRIPLTVGEVYGDSGLPESDELSLGAPVAEVALRARSRDGTLILLGGRLEADRAVARSDAPVELAVVGGRPRTLQGLGADGEGIALSIAPAGPGDLTLDAAILLDRSGSMEAAACFGRRAITIHGAAVAALAEIGRDLRDDDAVDLWEFSDAPSPVAADPRDPLPTSARFRAALDRLSAPDGGTEIGRALEAVLAARPRRDILVVTDGRSHALDVHALARSGRRISAVLIGEDSFEAHIGHLAALTGGALFIAPQDDVAGAIRAAVGFLRSASEPARATPAGILQALRSGARIEVRPGPAPAEPSPLSRAVAAMAAWLRLPGLPEPEAARLSEATGLVTHLTSLVLVDEAGAVQDDLPATRRVPLATPRVASPARVARMLYGIHGSPKSNDMTPSPERIRQIEAKALKHFRTPSPPKRLRFFLDDPRPAPTSAPDLWRALIDALADLDWSQLPASVTALDAPALRPQAALIRELARTPLVAELAAEAGLDPLALVLALLAAQAPGERHAARIARALLGPKRQAQAQGWLDRLAPPP
jgi:hypothetical protein